MGELVNVDLVLLGAAIAAVVILSFGVFFQNKKSSTSRGFLFFGALTVFWGITNYIAYQIHIPEVSLWFFRLVLFFAIWHDFFIFHLFYVFPREAVQLPKWYKFGLIPLVALVSILNLTPLVFSGIGEISPEGDILKINNGPGIAVFGTVVFSLVIGGISLLIRKLMRSRGIERTQLYYVLAGTVITFTLLITFNFILPAFFDNPRFIPLGGAFILPFAAFMSYAIFRHHLLNLKVVATEIIAFVLTLATLLEVIISTNPIELILRAGVFCLVLGFSILLIKSVLREVEQREQLQKLTEELKVANIKLEDLSRFKTQLLSLASHQIKAPLATIKQFGSLITDGIHGQVPDKVKETVGRMRYSADQLLALINDLLDLRKVEEGRMEYKFEKTDLKKMVSDVVEMNRVTATTSEKKLELTYAQPQGDVFVNADGQKLRQVIQNLVDNAIKYTNEGFVRVSLKIEGTDALVSVQDSGYGIPAALLPHLFEEFVRDERVKKQIRGTGLGLFIARKILEAHAGKLWATSEGEGKGSTFFARLPLAK